MAQIQVLPDSVINKIAAGEVVDRPASVVKELVENALDAGATRISVTVVEGGKEQITVLDDGVGMEAEDARLSVQRHATSKIRNEQELAHIQTLGFRGEALASIAAVSKFELTSCHDASQGGLRLTLEGGRFRNEGKVGFPRGTKVVVDDLFFNTPARKKFLRATQTEFQHIQNMIVQNALAHPGVRFRLTHNQRTIYDLPGCGPLPAGETHPNGETPPENTAQRGDTAPQGNTAPQGDTALVDRVAQLFGPQLADSLLPAAGAESVFQFRGLSSHPSHSQGSRRWQYLFINGRPVRNAGINHAVYQAYRTLLMSNRHPAYVLMVTLQPDEVDVNVHPAKTEVRLRNPSLIHAALSTLLHRGLMETTRREMFGQASPAQRAGEQAGGQGMLDLPGGGVQGVPGVLSLLSDGGVNTDGGVADNGGFSRPYGQSVQQGLPAGAARSDLNATQHQAHGNLAEASPLTRPAGDSSLAGGSSGLAGGGSGLAGGASGLVPNPFGSEGFHFQPLSPGAGAEPALLGGGMVVLSQFHNTYLLVQKGDALLLVDQHAAHERILFEQYRTQFYQGSLHTERFLLPINLELSPQNALLLEQYLPQWNKMGFEIEPFGKGSYLVRQAPSLLAGKDLQTLILEVLDELALFGKSGRLEEIINEILERVACHGAIRAGMILSAEEMNALVAQLEGLDINLYCPHGRPVWVEMPLKELEKRFKRTV